MLLYEPNSNMKHYVIKLSMDENNFSFNLSYNDSLEDFIISIQSSEFSLYGVYNSTTGYKVLIDSEKFVMDEDIKPLIKELRVDIVDLLEEFVHLSK